MKLINQRFEITYQYPVYFTRHIFQKGNDTFNHFLEQYAGDGREKQILFVLDEGLLKQHSQLREEIAGYFQENTAIKLAPFIVVPGGEVVKNVTTHQEKIIAAINQYKIDRHSFVAVIGGGSVLDMVGYAAAVAHRGIRHIRIPTTVLSQNDSGVGVKNGINYFGKKNFLGTFSPPVAVFNDSCFLNSLDNRSWRGGISEAVKVALIKDNGFFEWLNENSENLVHRDEESMSTLIYRCAALHLQHIASGDPFESGSSRPLDFGHWSAHKLEQLTHFSVLHGEAVAMGIALDVIYSREIGWLKAEEAERVLALLRNLGLKLFHPMMEDPALVEGLEEFREHLGGELTVMLLKGLGKGENIHAIDLNLMKHCIQLLKAYANDAVFIS